MIRLGDKVKDRYSGLVGYAMARIEHLNGCVQIEIQPIVTKDGRLPEAIGVDIDQLVKVGKKKPMKKKKNGGFYRR